MGCAIHVHHRSQRLEDVEFINNISDDGKKCDGIDGKVVALMIKKSDRTTYRLVPLPAYNDGDDDDRPRMMWIRVDSYITQSDDYWSTMTQNVARAVRRFDLKVSLMGASMNSDFGASSREEISDSDGQFVNTVDIYTSLALDGTSTAAVNIAAETINSMLNQPEKTVFKQTYGCVIYSGAQII